MCLKCNFRTEKDLHYKFSGLKILLPLVVFVFYYSLSLSLVLLFLVSVLVLGESCAKAFWVQVHSLGHLIANYDRFSLLGKHISWNWCLRRVISLAQQYTDKLIIVFPHHYTFSPQYNLSNIYIIFSKSNSKSNSI